MVNEITVNCSRIYAVGDIHGYFNQLLNLVKRYGLKDTCIIVCGDCGLGFYKPKYYENTMKQLQQTCVKRNVVIVMVRGNHDNPAYFNNWTAGARNIIAVPDYTVVNNSILCVGGAVSIDRKDRISETDSLINHYLRTHPNASMEDAEANVPKQYWPDEAPVYDEQALEEIKSAGIKITTVITHTCPDFCQPTGKNGLESWMKADSCLAEDVEAERSVMTMIYNKLVSDGHPVAKWVYGHFHQHMKYVENGIEFTMLDCVEHPTMNPDWVEIAQKDDGIEAGL